MSLRKLNEAENSKRSIDLARFERQREFRRQKKDLVHDIQNTLENGDYTTEDILALNRRIDLLTEENKQTESGENHRDSDSDLERRKGRLFFEVFRPYSDAIRREIDIIQTSLGDRVTPVQREQILQTPEILHARQKLKRLLLLNLPTRHFHDVAAHNEYQIRLLAERYDLNNVLGGKKKQSKTKRKGNTIIKRRNNRNKRNKSNKPNKK